MTPAEQPRVWTPPAAAGWLSIDESISRGQRVRAKSDTRAQLNLLRPLSEGFWMNKQVLEGYYPPTPLVCHHPRAEGRGGMPGAWRRAARIHRSWQLPFSLSDSHLMQPASAWLPPLLTPPPRRPEQIRVMAVQLLSSAAWLT